MVLYSAMDGSLGRVLRSCGFDIREIPKRNGRQLINQGQVLPKINIEDCANIDKVLRLSGFETREIPKGNGGHESKNQGQVLLATRDGDSRNNEPNNGNLGKEQIILQINHLEKTSKYLTFMQTAGKVAASNGLLNDNVQKQIAGLINEGIVENYEYTIKAIRLNPRNATVASILGNGANAGVISNNA